jgi:oligopeptide/dipeptide ABC transporter ATP-binding protein
MEQESLLTVRGLGVDFDTPQGRVRALSDASLELRAGECLAVVGESGSGKSQLFLACLGLLAENGRAAGSARFGGTELIGASEHRLNQFRGTRIGTVFQDPMNALTPHLRVVDQLTETVTERRLMTPERARRRAVEVLRSVGFADPDLRLAQYPHELSGGQRQRVAIAMALMADPALLIADEPTTALDVTVQAQLLAILGRLRDGGLAIVLITHDLGVVAGIADRVAVMYAGRVVETAPAEALFSSPAHPYSAALLATVPRLHGTTLERLSAIAGQPPAPQEQLPGCRFAPRCPAARPVCRRQDPSMTASGDRAVACHAPLPQGWAP